MAAIGVGNLSMYSRKMLIDGYIIRRDFSELKELTKQLAYLARSINQIAKCVNSTQSIYAHEVRELQKSYAEVKRRVSERLVKMIREEQGG